MQMMGQRRASVKSSHRPARLSPWGGDASLALEPSRHDQFLAKNLTVTPLSRQVFDRYN